MFERLETRFYPREELAGIAGLDAKAHNFSADMKTRLKNWGYDYEFKPRKGYLITRVPTTPEERLVEYLRRDVHIDTQINVLHFACFMSAFVLIPHFFSMPWPEREALLLKYYDVEITDRTMMSWLNKLGESGYLYSSRSSRNLWHTYTLNGSKVREIADREGPEYKHYCRERSAILNGYAKLGIQARSIWGEMVHQLYNEHGVYYYCKSIEFNGFKIADLDAIYDLTEEIIRKKTD